MTTVTSTTKKWRYPVTMPEMIQTSQNKLAGAIGLMDHCILLRDAFYSNQYVSLYIVQNMDDPCL